MNAELRYILKAIQIDVRKADVRDILKDIQNCMSVIEADLKSFHEKIDAYIDGDSKIIGLSKKKRPVKAVKEVKA